MYLCSSIHHHVALVESLCGHIGPMSFCTVLISTFINFFFAQNGLQDVGLQTIESDMNKNIEPLCLNHFRNVIFWLKKRIDCHVNSTCEMILQAEFMTLSINIITWLCY